MLILGLVRSSMGRFALQGEDRASQEESLPQGLDIGKQPPLLFPKLTEGVLSDRPAKLGKH